MLQSLALETKEALNNLPPLAKKTYVKLLFDVIARSLVAVSKKDLEMQQELEGFKSGMTVELAVIPNTASFKLRLNDNNEFERISNPIKADLSLKIKHVNLAFMLFTFQEGTATAFAHDRIIADGDLSDAIRFLRCLNRLESVILPKVIAQLAVKSYPDLKLKQKLQLATSVYSGVALSLFKR